MNEIKWIPVKERLPEKDGRYLVSCGDYIGIEDFTTDLLGLEVTGEPADNVSFFDEEYKDKIISGEYKNSGFYSIDEERVYGEWLGDYLLFVHCNEKCAWMPLPEAYKEED